MKHKFYYSRKQAAIDPDHFCFVFNGTDYVEYSQWCHEDICLWDDAVLVFETDDDPQIKVVGGLLDSPWDISEAYDNPGVIKQVY